MSGKYDIGTGGQWKRWVRLLEMPHPDFGTAKPQEYWSDDKGNLILVDVATGKASIVRIATKTFQAYHAPRPKRQKPQVRVYTPEEREAFARAVVFGAPKPKP